jgi:hypothetical protein
MLKGPNLPPSPCTACGKVSDTATHVGSDIAPSPGDMTICFYCHHLMVFTNNLTQRDLTDDEMIEVAGDPTLVNATKILGAFKKL